MNDLNEPVLTAKNIRYDIAGRTIFKDLNFTINKGEFVVILGPNGAGKSTLLKLILGLIEPTSGNLSVLGNPPKRGNSEIGYTPQHRELESALALRARDVVGFGLDGNKWGISLPNRQRDQTINRVLKEVNALSFADAPVGTLSGGEQQRLLIAQALLTNPKLFLLDEPLSNLDITSSREVVNLVGRVCRERSVTVMLVTHDINPLLSAADRVLYLAHGKGEIGTPDKVITSVTLTKLYGSLVEVVHAKGKICVIGENN